MFSCLLGLSQISSRPKIIIDLIIIIIIIIIMKIIMSIIKPEFAQAENALRHVSMSNRNAFSLFVKVLRDMSVDRRLCDSLFQTTGPLTY